MTQNAYVLAQFFGENPQQLLEFTPHCREIGLLAVHAGPCEATLKIPYQQKLVGDPARGVVFGGVITTLLDQAGGVAVLCSLDDLTAIATIDLRVDYMRPATPGLDLIGYAHCYRRARHVAFVRGAAYHEDPNDPFATFLSTYMIGANPKPPNIQSALTEGGTS